MILPDWSTVIRGAPRVVASDPRCSQVHPKFSPALRGVPNLVTITAMVLLYHSLEISVTPNAGRNALLGSDTLLKLTHLSLHSTSSETLLEAPSDWNTICWCPWASAKSQEPAQSNGMFLSIVGLHKSVIRRRNDQFGNGTWRTTLSTMVRTSRQHLTSSRMLAFPEGTIGSTKPWLRYGNLSTLVCNSSPRCIYWTSWWCVDREDEKEESSDYRSSLMKVRCNSSTDVVV